MNIGPVIIVNMYHVNEITYIHLSGKLREISEHWEYIYIVTDVQNTRPTVGLASFSPIGTMPVLCIVSSISVFIVSPVKVDWE